MSVSAKLKTLKAGHLLRSGGLIGHRTSTLPGIAASAFSQAGISRAQCFKQRQGPFLLLADSIATALQQAAYITPALRSLAKASWPGSVTLVFSAKQQLAKACYSKGFIAIRVDGDAETRRLAESCGGLIISSSLNRKGKAVQTPTRRLRYRLHRHLSAVISARQQPAGQASNIFKVTGNKIEQLR